MAFQKIVIHLLFNSLAITLAATTKTDQWRSKEIFFGFGKRCPSVEPMKNFDVTRYIGKWFEIEKYSAIFERGDCVVGDLSMNSNVTIKVINSEVVKGSLSSIEGYATLPNPSVGALVVTIPVSNPRPPTEPNYNILETDYDQYAVVHDCQEIIPGLLTKEYNWILSKTENLPPSFDLVGLKQRLSEMGISIENFKETNQENCKRLAGN